MAEITDTERLDFITVNGLELKDSFDKICVFYGGIIVGSGRSPRDAIDMAIRSKSSMLREVS